MKYRAQFRSFNPQHQRGFALVVTLSLMILLTVIAVGLLTLSSISLRSSAQGSAMATAQANARLALMLAIGDLQKNAGPDQRITAPGGILDENATHPNWIGVWDSWKAGSGSSASDEPSQHSTIADGGSSGLAPKYESARADHFRRWLVSGTSEEALRTVDGARSGTLADSTSPAPNASAVTLVSNGSLGSGAPDSEKVKVQLVGLSRPGNTPGTAGRIGWWVGDESLKARIKDDVYRDGTVDLTDSTRAFRQQSPSRANHRFLPEMGNIADEAPFALVSTRASLQLLEGAGTATNRSFHHATPYSRGLLSDVREGGLKRDLSTILERPIRTEDTSDEFMLYRFDRLGQESVPFRISAPITNSTGPSLKTHQIYCPVIFRSTTRTSAVAARRSPANTPASTASRFRSASNTCSRFFQCPGRKLRKMPIPPTPTLINSTLASLRLSPSGILTTSLSLSTLVPVSPINSASSICHSRSAGPKRGAATPVQTPFLSHG